MLFRRAATRISSSSTGRCGSTAPPPSGVGARFDPGVAKTVRLVRLAGTGEVYGQGGLTNGDTNDADVKARAIAAARANGYLGA